MIMILTVAFSLVERFGFVLVLITFLSLGVAYNPVSTQEPTDLVLQFSALGLGAIALWIAYSLVRVALPECGLMALATSAFLAVLPGHVVALSSHVLLGVAEGACGLVLLNLVRAARAAVLERQPAAGEPALAAAVARGASFGEVPAALYTQAAPDTAAVGRPAAGPTRWPLGMLLDLGFWSGIVVGAAPGALAIFPLLPVSLLALGWEKGLQGRALLWETVRGTFVASATAMVVSGVALVMARWLGANPILPLDLATTTAGTLGILPAALYSFSGFWLPFAWALSPYSGVVLGVLAAVSAMGIVGAGRYAVSAVRRQAGLEEPERAAFDIFYVAAVAALVSVAAVVVRGAAPGPGMVYPFLAPLALLGLIGFEDWFPPLIRPLLVFALLVGLFALDLYGLAALT